MINLKFTSKAPGQKFFKRNGLLAQREEDYLKSNTTTALPKQASSSKHHKESNSTYTNLTLILMHVLSLFPYNSKHQ